MKKIYAYTYAIAAACSLMALPAGAVSIPVTADSTVRGAFPNQIFGAAPQLGVDSDSSTYLYFDLTGALPFGIPPSSVEKATLVLYAASVATPGFVNVDIACTAWSESTLNYSNRPSSCGGSVTFMVTQPGFVTADVTKLVGPWVENNLANVGIVLTAASRSGAGAVVFASKENTGAGQPPRLDITLAQAAGPAGPQGLPGPAGLPGPQGPAVSGATTLCSGGTVAGGATLAGATCTCPSATFFVTISSYTSGAFDHQIWSGSTKTLTLGACSVTVIEPSEPIDYTLYDSPTGWDIGVGSGWRRCTVMALKPSCGSPGAVASIANGNFPSCSAALGGSASTASAYVFCRQ